MGWEDPNTTISGLSMACQRNAILLAFRWCADDGQTLNASLVALCDFFRGSGPVLLRNPVFFNFSGGGGGQPDPPMMKAKHQC